LLGDVGSLFARLRRLNPVICGEDHLKAIRSAVVAFALRD
jgi:hypothetical protein